MTQEALASAIKLTRSSITNIEAGRQRMLLETFIEIAEALDVAPEDLLPHYTPHAGKTSQPERPPDVTNEDWEIIQKTISEKVLNKGEGE